MNKRTLTSTLLLLLTAMIWGAAFVAQSVGAEHVGPLTFLATRSLLGCLVLLPLVIFRVRKHLQAGVDVGNTSHANLQAGVDAGSTSHLKENNGHLQSGTGLKALLRQMLPAGCICGLFLFLASLSQQAGIAYTTTAKAGFITALYVVLVPVLGSFFGRRPGLIIWLCVVLSVVGLYFLSIKSEFSLEMGDTLVILAAFLFACQILSLDHFAPKMDPILLSFLEYMVQGLLAGILLPFFEHPSLADLSAALPAILYAGICSTGIAYTLQVVAQKGLDPTIASMLMSLEGVFAALFGWLLLGEGLTLREFFGCVLMFAAVILASIFGGSEKEKEED